MEQEIAYLDNAATTRVCEESVAAATRMMRECFGNPSSLHTLGVDSARELSQARDSVAALMGCDAESVCFTSGGSEANNTAILGAAHALARRGKKIVTTAAEHSSVTAAFQHLAQSGWDVTFVPPEPSGILQAEKIAQAVDQDTTLVSMMLVNNETGAVFPVEQAARLIKAKNPDTLIHCDAVQAFGKLPVRLSRIGADLVSVSGHKICAPKGSGALYVRRGVRVRPLIFGGGQEHGLRSGTENLPAIVAFGAACKRLQGKIAEYYDRVKALRQILLKELLEIENVCINSPDESSPYILNASLPGYRSEIMLHYLEQQQIYVSSGSACSKGAPSAVLAAMKLARPVADSALRISLIYDTDEQELHRLTQALAQAHTVLRK